MNRRTERGEGSPLCRRRRPRLGIRAACAACAAALTILAGCGGNQSAPASSGGAHKTIKTIAFATATQAGEVYVQMTKNFVDAGKKVGIDVHVYNNNGSATDMISNANIMVQSQPDLIVDEPPVASAAARVGDIFQRSKIPCVAVNVSIPNCQFFNFDQPYLSKLVATYYASTMAQRGWDGNNTAVVIGENSNYGPTVNIAVTSFYDALSSTVPKMTHVAASAISTSTTGITPDQGLQVDLGTTLDDAFTAMTHLLPSLPSTRHLVIYTLSDESAKGVVRALTNAQRVNDAMLSAYGEDNTAIDSVRAGGAWIAESAGFFTSWGEFIIAQGQAMLNGTTIPSVTAPPMIAITKDNVSTYFALDDSIVKFPPLPPESSYLAQTGILQKFGNVEGVQ